MEKYRVKVQRIQGINKNTHVAGDVVTSDMFPEGVAKKLCEDGKIESIETKSEAKGKAKAETKSEAKE